MGQLDPESGRARCASCDRHHAGKCRFVVIGVEAETAMADSAARLHARRLDHDKARAGKPERAQMLDMPIGGRAIFRAVLAHWRDDDPVRQFNGAELKRAEEGTWHRISLEKKTRTAADRHVAEVEPAIEPSRSRSIKADSRYLRGSYLQGAGISHPSP